MEWCIASPRNAALQILAARFEAGPETPTTIPLADFQREGATRAAAIMRERGGVLLADSVGLGKTFIALALIEAALARNEKVLLVVPASLRQMWRTELRKLGASNRWTLVSHTQLALTPPAPSAWGLIVVDEAHAFRNPRTRRYRALRAVSRGSRVVLLTATPVNNSLSDLYFELRLFCSDTAFRDIGIGSLRALLRSREDPPRHLLERLRRAIIVRRTRSEVRSTAAAAGFRFPAHVDIAAIGYGLPLSTAQLSGFLNRVSFAAYRVNGARWPPELLRFALLKRIESSIHAGLATLRNQIRFHEEFCAALPRGRLVRPQTFHSLYAQSEDTIQLVLEEVVLESERIGTKGLHAAVQKDLQTLREWELVLRSAHDDKLQKLVTVLNARVGAKTIVFTEYRDTALHLWRALRRRFATALIHGSGAWIGEAPAARRVIVERFAPAGNGGRAVHPREVIDVLIATDVLAEGMNLQDADAVASYDLPWNPVRLIQRAGRVDRIGSVHDVVSVYNFLPDREFDAFLGLARTIRNKLMMVRESVGLERPVLEPDEDFAAVAQALTRNDASILNRIDAGAESELRKAYERSPPVAVTGVPVASIGTEDGRILVGARRGPLSEVVVFERDGSVSAADSDQILLRALADDIVRPVDLKHCASICSRALTQLDASIQSGGSDRRDAGMRVAKLVRETVAAVPIDQATRALYASADEVLERLSGILDITVEEALEMVIKRPFASAAQLLAEVKKALCRNPSCSLPDVAWSVTGVIVAD